MPGWMLGMRLALEDSSWMLGEEGKAGLGGLGTWGLALRMGMVETTWGVTRWRDQAAVQGAGEGTPPTQEVCLGEAEGSMRCL